MQIKVIAVGVEMIQRLPDWLRVRAPRPDVAPDVQIAVTQRGLHTVCESARCPNLNECWSKHTATFMILGEVCSRNCRYCAVGTGKCEAVDDDEPYQVAVAARELQLKHVVVTSVTRDDLPDGGAEQFAKTIAAIREFSPHSIIEVLTPDFQGKFDQLRIVMDAKPDIFNHNVETVPELFHIARPQAQYHRSLLVLQEAKRQYPQCYTKSGMMVGLGETEAQVIQVMKDLRAHQVDAMTIGQYIRPTTQHLEVAEYIHPDQFEAYQKLGEELGFLFVASAPLVRSSYNAAEFSRRLWADRAQPE